MLLVLVLDPLDPEMDVWPIEAGDDQLWRFEPQQCDDVVTHLRCRGCGEGRHRRTGPAAGRPAAGRGGAQAPVVRTEVVSPLGHAVRLVYDEACDLELAKQSHERRRCESLRGHIEQAQLSRPHGVQDGTPGIG